MLLLRRSWVRGLELSVLFWNFSFKIKKLKKKCRDVRKGQPSLLLPKARQRSKTLSPGPLSWPDRRPTLSPPAATRTPCPQPPAPPPGTRRLLRPDAAPSQAGTAASFTFRPNPTQPEGLAHCPTEGHGHPSRLCPLPAVRFPGSARRFPLSSVSSRRTDLPPL